MKRILALLLALSMLLVFSGCDFFEKEEEEEFDVEECLEEAEALVKEGKLEAAERLLKKGIRKSDDDEELEAYLEVVQNMMDEDAPNTETMPATTAPTTTQVPTTEAPQQPETTVGTNMLESFGSDEMKRINIFLSNFSEQSFEAYPCSDYDLLKFGYIYAKINNREILGSTDSHYYINKANMDSVLERFFGSTVNLADGTVLTQYNYPITYQGGAYYYPAADGASYSMCSVATSMVDNGNGTYTVTFNVYSHVNPHESMSAFYSMTDAQASSSGSLQYLQSGVAVVRDYTRSSGVESYQLVSYSCQ